MAMPKGAQLMRKEGSKQIVGMADVTDMQRTFIQQYIRNGGNATEAARVAGYSQPNVSAFTLLRNPNVARVIAVQVLPRMARMAHGVADLLEEQLDVWKEMVAEDPRFVLELPTKELRALLATALSHILPPASAQPSAPDVSRDMSIEELQTALDQAEAAAARAAKLIPGDVSPVSGAPSPDASPSETGETDESE